MWTRENLKARGKAALKRNYGKTLLVALVLSLVGGGIGLPGVSTSFSGENADQLFLRADREKMILVTLAVIGVAVVVSLLATAISVFVLNPLQVGCQRFFVKNSVSPADPAEMGYGFRSNYKNVVLTMFMSGLFVFLWSLLFIIPGIVKSYAYRMVPYLLAEDPDMSWREALERSEEMMKGQKGSAFWLDLSFLGWQILGAFTFGLLSILFVNPYQLCTNAELYQTLRNANAPQTAETPLVQ